METYFLTMGTLSLNQLLFDSRPALSFMKKKEYGDDYGYIARFDAQKILAILRGEHAKSFQVSKKLSVAHNNAYGALAGKAIRHYKFDSIMIFEVQTKAPAEVLQGKYKIGGNNVIAVNRIYISPLQLQGKYPLSYTEGRKHIAVEFAERRYSGYKGICIGIQDTFSRFSGEERELEENCFNENYCQFPQWSDGFPLIAQDTEIVVVDKHHGWESLTLSCSSSAGNLMRLRHPIIPGEERNTDTVALIPQQPKPKCC